MQKRDNKTIYTKKFFDSPYENKNSFGATYGQHRECLEFGQTEYQQLVEFSKSKGITFFSTAFDLNSFYFLEELDMPFYKIASSDITHIPLIEAVAKTGKPVIISTGGASAEDIDRAASLVLSINEKLVILQCTAAYPPVHEELNLRFIQTLREKYPKQVIGLSSHDNGIAMDLVGYVLGARVIEKHFTLNRANKGTDNSFSLEPQGLAKLVRDLSRAKLAFGDGQKTVFESEKAPILKMRKKMVYRTNLPKGHVIQSEDIGFKSPADGLPPYMVEKFLGKTLLGDVLEDQDLESTQI